jgi:hypothetical protein
LGKACFFWSSNDFLTSASLTLTLRAAASCCTHCAWIRNCMTWALSWSYCCRHCFFSWSSDCLPAPLGWACFLKSATHVLNSGGSGTGAVCPPCCWPEAAFLSQRLNSFFVIAESPTLATELPGTSLPQPATTAAAARAANGRRRAGVDRKVMC